nr:hypothetical protein [Tanacetum cinerariifolium]
MDNKKHIVNLESSRDMLHICPRLSGQSFVEPPFEEKILAFLRFLRHSRAIRKLTDMEHKETKKSNEMYYPRFTKVISHHFMSKDPLIPRRNKFHALLPIELTNEDIRNSNAYKEYYAVAIGATPPKPKASVQKTRSSSDITVTPPTAATGPRLTTSEKGKQAAKASKAKSLSALSEVAMIKAQQLKLSTKRSLQQTHISQASGSGADKGTGSIPGVLDVPIDESEEDISWKSTDDEGDDNEGNDGGNDDDDDGDDNEEGDGNDDDEDDDGKEGNDEDREDEGDDDEDDEEKGGDDEQASDEEEFIHPRLSTHTEEEPRDEESFDPILKTPKDTNDEGNGEENLGLNVSREEGYDEEEEEDELYKDVNINQGRGIQTTQEFEDSHVTQTLVNPDGQQQRSFVSSQFTLTSVASLSMSAPNITPFTIATITTTQQAPTTPTTAPSTLLQDLPNFGSLFGFDNRMRTLETIDENMQKIIKEQVKEQVKASESATAEEPRQTTFEMEAPSHPEFETGADD